MRLGAESRRRWWGRGELGLLGGGGALQRCAESEWAGLLLQEPAGVHVGVDLKHKQHAEKTFISVSLTGALVMDPIK